MICRHLSTDPHEFKNLASLPEHAPVIRELHARMIQEVGGDPDETELRARRQLAEGDHRTDKPPKGSQGAGE